MMGNETGSWRPSYVVPNDEAQRRRRCETVHSEKPECRPRCPIALGFRQLVCRFEAFPRNLKDLTFVAKVLDVSPSL